MPAKKWSILNERHPMTKLTNPGNLDKSQFFKSMERRRNEPPSIACVVTATYLL